MIDLLKAEDLNKTYHDGERELAVLKGLNLTVEAGEAIAIVGMSGAGKSTLLHILGGLDHPDSGRIVFQGEDVTSWPRGRMNEYRSASIGFVFQFHHLLPEFTALENVMMPALVARKPRGAASARASDLLTQMGLAERATHRPGRLSGGEQQRVALARALMNEPALLLADEPTGNLDLRTGGKVIEAIWGATVEAGKSLIIVTHEPSIAERANRIFMLRAGRLEPVERGGVARKIQERANA